MNFAEALVMITGYLDAKQIPEFCNIMWCLWKARNEEMFTEKKPTVQEILAKERALSVSATDWERGEMITELGQASVTQGSRVILVDGSWDVKNKAGTGMAVYNRRWDLVYTSLRGVIATDAFSAEVEAVWKALIYIMQHGDEGLFMCYSDNKYLVHAILNQSIEGIPSWKAAEKVQECINITATNPEKILLQHINRKAMKTPHMLANWERTTERTEEGTPIQCNIGHLEIEHCLNEVFFNIT